MTIQLTKATYVSGVLAAAGSQHTLDAQTESYLVHIGAATWVETAYTQGRFEDAKIEYDSDGVAVGIVGRANEVVGPVWATDDSGNVTGLVGPDNAIIISTEADVTVYGADKTGATDSTAAINAAILAVESAKTGVVYFPAGTYRIDGTILSVGSNWSSEDTTTIEFGTGGIEFRGAGIRATRLIGASGKTLMQIGSAASKVAYKFSNMWLDGPGMSDENSIAIDSRTTGGGYIFESVLVSQFDIGVRFYDNTSIAMTNVYARWCGTGYAIGYYSADGLVMNSCTADFCTTGMWIGYYDTARSQTAGNVEWHSAALIACKFNINDVALFIEGNAAGAISIIGCYFEQYRYFAIKVGDSASAHSCSANVNITSCFFNGNRQVAAPTGKVASAIEINYAIGSVVVDGGSFRNHTEAPIKITNAASSIVQVNPGNYSTSSGESGSVKLPDNSYLTVGNHRPITYGKRSHAALSIYPPSSALPTAGVDYLGWRVSKSGVVYECTTDGSSGYRWTIITKMLVSTKPIAYNVTPSNTMTLVANECRHSLIFLPVAAYITKARVQIGTSSGNISVAIYSQDGATRHATTGAIACPASGKQDVSFSAGVALDAGVYIIALSADNATAVFHCCPNGQIFGANNQAAAHPCPLTISAPDGSGVGNMPAIGVF